MSTSSFRGVAWATLDQIAYGIIYFLPSLWLANRMNASLYGVYSIALVVVYFALGIHSALFIEPMLVLSRERFAESPGYVGALVRLHLAFCGIVTLLFAAGGMVLALHSPELAWAIGVSGLTAGALMSVALVRRLAHIMEPHHVGVTATLLYGVSLLVGILVLELGHRTSPASVLLVMGIAALTLPLLGNVRRFARTHAPLLPMLRDTTAAHLRHGRWLLYLSPFRWVLDGLPVLLAGILLGLTGAAALRAATNLIAPVIQLIGSMRLSLMPTFVSSGDARRARRLAMEHIALLLLVCALYYVFLMTLGGSVMHLLYQGRYDHARGLLPIVGLLPPIMSAALTFGSVLRARQSVHQSFLSFALAALVGATTLLFGVHEFGLVGAAAAYLVGYVVLLVSKFCFARRHLAADSRNYKS